MTQCQHDELQGVVIHSWEGPFWAGDEVSVMHSREHFCIIPQKDDVYYKRVQFFISNLNIFCK